MKTASPDEKTLDVCEKYWLSSSLAVEDPRVQGLDLLTVCTSAKPSFGIKSSDWDSLKRHSVSFATDRCGLRYFCSWNYCLYISKSFPLRAQTVLVLQKKCECVTTAVHGVLPDKVGKW